MSDQPTQPTRQPLDIHADHWRSRWLVNARWKVLHRVSEIAWDGDEDEMIEGIGTTVCGFHGHLRMPGIFSRMDLPRCAHCCRLVGIPLGNGAPFNSSDPRIENA